ncbi:MAG: hypothetical protein A3G87_05810 [Omnitrophica bacterium RIFCSPLOWO2_12_FULL_50_11]|nr:MAG: hypothetical protein A3G87_05810 [Omnitrophica bacterium RIFCSPLOWO2_12_FULL_50_11]
MLKVFLDANVYFVGFSSRTGASALVLEIARRQKIAVYAARFVLREADRNLRKKSTPANLKSFRRYVQNVKIHVVPFPKEETTQPYEDDLHLKDLPVLGAALESKADYLLSLDKKHLLTSRLTHRVKKLNIMSPGDFLTNVYRRGKI